MPRPLLVFTVVLVLLGNALPVFAQEKRGVDVVIILDTSGPMLDGFDKFCAAFPRDVTALQQRGFDLQVAVLGITKPYACAKDTQGSLLQPTAPQAGDAGLSARAAALSREVCVGLLRIYSASEA